MRSLLCAAIVLLASPSALGAGLRLEPSTFSQKLDHASQSAPKFPQRVWVSSEFAKEPQSPILLRICGESDCEQQISTDDLSLFAKRLHARVVYLEHRYYGWSQPFPDLSTEHLQFLTLGNAVEDLATFLRAQSQVPGWQGKWIAIGGSYSGSLAAFLRQQHPELVVGALASSAPMGTASDASEKYGQEDQSDPRWLSPDQSARQWLYQACTEVGFWLASPIGGSVVPSSAYCEASFGKPKSFDQSRFDALYLRPFTESGPGSASRILFTNGSFDPWSRYGITPGRNRNAQITAYMIEGGRHHADLNRDVTIPEVQEARELFLKLAEQWLTPSGDGSL